MSKSHPRRPRGRQSGWVWGEDSGRNRNQNVPRGSSGPSCKLRSLNFPNKLIVCLFVFFVYYYFLLLLYHIFLTFTILTIQYNINMPIGDYVRIYVVRFITINYSTLGNI